MIMLDLVLVVLAVFALHLTKCVAPIKSPVYIWPLGEGINYRELVTGSLAGTGHNVGFQLGPAGTPGGLDYNAPVFNKSESSYVDIPVAYSSRLMDDYSISFHLRVESDGDGVFLHYKSDSVSAGQINNIILSIVAGDVVTTVTEGNGLTSTMTALTNLTDDQWYRMVLERDLVMPTLTIYIDGTAVEVIFASWVTDKTTGFPGTLRLGRDQHGSHAFSGGITCVQFVDSKNPTPATDYDNECKRANWPPLTTTTTTSSTTYTTTTTAITTATKTLTAPVKALPATILTTSSTPTTPSTATTTTTQPRTTTTPITTTTTTTQPKTTITLKTTTTTPPTATITPITTTPAMTTPVMFPAIEVKKLYNGTSHFKVTSYNATYASLSQVLGMSSMERKDCVWLCIADGACRTFVVKTGICLLGVGTPTLTYAVNSTVFTLM